MLFEKYRQLIRLRHEHPVFIDGEFELLLPDDEDLFAYTRTDDTARLLVVCNFHGRILTDPLAEMEKCRTILYCNYEDCPDGAQLRPYEAKVFWQPVTEGGK